MRVALVGAPGTDACTLGRLLASRLGAQHVSVRRLIDLEVTHQTALGVELASQLAARPGALLPMRLVAPLLDQLWGGSRPPTSFVLSGYPRDAQQWRHLRRHTDVSQVIHLRSDADLLRTSAPLRCSCPACSARLYPDELVLRDGRVLPAVLECCGSAREPIPPRTDAAAIFEARLAAYEATTRPWLDSQRESGLVQEMFADVRWPQLFPILERLVGLAPNASATASISDSGAGASLRSSATHSSDHPS
ncbi:hypothetical protein KFE25_001154 [Diacronema lutheri]|uniref:Adenylate kinase n=1 Tax=Diacronema lutheri TaxID=2081491 RepID=A0A8J5XET5_DIALT|nr:hypothetical protein KFE25_001154 [Diacronema lutheri]